MGSSTGAGEPVTRVEVSGGQGVVVGDHAIQDSLADAYREAGRPEQAIPLFERTLADREQVLGETHPDTLGSRNSLALVYPGSRAAGAGDPAIRADPR